ncbi:MAG: GNAT family N-acetyltransferase [Bacteroidota bacterium]
MNFVVASKVQLAIVRDLAYKIWPPTFEKILSTEQIDYMLNMMYSMASLEEQLQSNRVFLLAEEGNGFIGFASYEVNFDNSNKTKIHKLYVLPETQGKGVGRQLIDFITDIALKNQDTILHLTVNKYNKATDFYLKNGFEVTEEVVFDIGNGYVMDDYIMEKKL